MRKYLLFLLIIPFFMFSQGKLKKAKQNIKGQSTTVVKEHKQNKSKTKTMRSSSIDNSFFNGFFIELAYRLILGIVFGDLGPRSFNHYPYSGDGKGEYTRNILDNTKKQNLRIGASVSPNGIKGVDFNAVYKPLTYLGLDASYVHLFEKSRDGLEQFNMASFLVNFYRVREKSFSLWWGLGTTYIANDINRFGFSYQAGLEIYPIKPVSIYLLAKQSSFSVIEDYGYSYTYNVEYVNDIKAKLRYHMTNKVLYLGYNYYNLASQRISSPSIGFEMYF